jgi:diguanylate cyclase (GGDEF)-like protein
MEGAPPSGSLVLGTFVVVTGLLVAAIAGLAAADGAGRLVDVFVLGAGLLLAYAAGLRIAPLVAAALVATYIALEGHYGRLDGDHSAAVLALALLFGAAALAAGALADGFEAWNRGGSPSPVPAEDGQDLIEPAPDPGDALEVDDLEGLLHQAIRNYGALSLLLTSPDAIERLGDQRGQDATRAVLDRVADVLRGHLRGTDVLHRHGLFEFWVILPRTSLEAARMTAERVRLAVGEGRVQLDDGEAVRTSVSIGISSCPIDGRTPGRLRGAAERALAAATQLGGNRTILHSVPPGAPRGWGLAPERDAGSAVVARRPLQ